VRGLFLGMGEGQNNEVKPAPRKRMDFRRSKCCKWRCIMRSEVYPSPNSPTNSLEEANIQEAIELYLEPVEDDQVFTPNSEIIELAV